LNILDLIIVAVIGLCVFAGYRKGLLYTLFRLVSFFAAIFLANRLYPYMSRFLMQTALYDTLKDAVIRSMGLGSFVQEHTLRQSTDLINNLPLPAALRDILLSNNTPDMYAFLNVHRVEDYVGGFFANMVFNVISMVLVFLLILLALKLLGGLLNFINYIPIIGGINRIGGLLFGFALGVVLVWVGLTLTTLLFATPANPRVYELVQGSLAARWLFENNWMLGLVTGIR
jgi:uncharacterized membrane protein required for colicin V production